MRVGELGGGPVQLAFEAIGAGEEPMRGRIPGIGATRLFEPRDRLVGARLEQMHSPNIVVSNSNRGVAGAEANGLLLELYCLGVGTARQELAEAETGGRADRVAIFREHLFKFGNGVFASVLLPQQMAPGEMSKWVSGG